MIHAKPLALIIVAAAEAIAPATDLPPWAAPAIGGLVLTAIGWSFTRNVREMDRRSEEDRARLAICEATQKDLITKLAVGIARGEALEQRVAALERAAA